MYLIYFLTLILGECEFTSSQEETVIKHLQETHEVKNAENVASEIEGFGRFWAIHKLIWRPNFPEIFRNAFLLEVRAKSQINK